MRTESPSGLRHRGTFSQLNEITPPASRGVRLETSEGDWVDAGIAPDDRARLREICQNLTRVRQSTDPVELKAGQSWATLTPFIFRDDKRRAAAFEALDEFMTLKAGLRADHWFCVFVLLDKMKQGSQAPALSKYLSREGPSENVDWSIEVMRHWLIRRSIGNNEALRSGAIGHLIRFWETSPHLRPDIAALLAYLLCTDPSIQRPAPSLEDWTSVLMLLPKSVAHGDPELTPGELTEPESLIAAGLLHAARAIDEAIDSGAQSKRFCQHLGNRSLLLTASLDSLHDFAVKLTRAEANSEEFVIYKGRFDAYRKREEERQARYLEAMERAARFAKSAGKVMIAVLKIAGEVFLNYIANRAIANQPVPR